MASDPSTTRLEAVTEALDGAGVEYEVHEHAPADTAVAEARAEHVPPHRVAKTLVLRDGDRWTLAVIPASHRLDLGKLREVIGAGHGLRMATEEEMTEHFPQYEVGAVPPVAGVVPSEVVDTRLLDQQRILFAAGDRRHSVAIDVRDLARITQATVADISSD